MRSNEPVDNEKQTRKLKIKGTWVLYVKAQIINICLHSKMFAEIKAVEQYTQYTVVSMLKFYLIEQFFSQSKFQLL